MAVASSPNSKASTSAQSEKNNKRKVIDDEKEIKSPDAIPQPPKRSKCPGVRVVHGRIYDPENGKTCHQCRQKTLDFSADCKNDTRKKPCSLKYCHTCLLNRYGEKAEVVALLEDWNCPRCRGICNCSICMKKLGHQPTGMLVKMAKASGFSSVSDLLHVKGAGNVGNYKSPKEACASPRKEATAEEGAVPISPRKLGKENMFDGTAPNMNPPPVASTAEDKSKKTKHKGSEVMQNSSGLNDVSLTGNRNAPDEKNRENVKLQRLNETDGGDKNGGVLETRDHFDKNKQKKMKIKGSKEMPEDNVDVGANMKGVSSRKYQDSKGAPKHGKTSRNTDGIQQQEKALKTSISEEDKYEERNKAVEALDSRINQKNNCAETKKSDITNKKTLDLHSKFSEAIIPLPAGSELVTIAGIDLPNEDAGSALQFLEFCAVFGKILDVRKGQAEVVLRELIKGRSSRRGKQSLIIQFHIQLLTVIQEELGTESPTLDPTHGSNSWLKALKSCIPDCHRLLGPLDCIDKEASGYDNLDFSTKLRLLNFLCDELLGTEKIRSWIDDQNIKFAEKRKEAKERFSAAKDKERSLKQKMQDEVAKAIIARNGAPLTISEHEAVVRQIKNEAAKAHAEMLESKRMVLKDKETPDALRTEAIFRDDNGHVYWRLKGYSEKSDILRQDIGIGDDTVESGEKWFRFDTEQMNEIEKHVNASREGRMRCRTSC